MDQAQAQAAEMESQARRFLKRINACRPLSPGAAIADIGSGPGLFLRAFARAGYRAVGVEPSPVARATTLALAEAERLPLEVVDGVAEKTNLPDRTFDLVFCNNVIEHVDDPAACFAEAFRILKPGGVYWWSSASSLAPHQGEIDGYWFFGWYPDAMKRRIMEHVKVHKPHLIGHTDRPALHWWTPRKARRMLRAAGFTRVLDRWDIRLPNEGGRLHAAGLRIVQNAPGARFLADVCVEGCAFLAVRP